MTLEQRRKYIELFVNNGFKCFPIKSGQKIADYRYKAEETKDDQIISDQENYGYIPIRNKGTAILDFDDKERFREFVQESIKQGYYATESPHGWHIPVINFSGDISKIELFDDTSDKKVLEIQSPKQYCVGPGCETQDGIYKPIDGKLFDAKNKDFNDFVDFLCKKLNLVSKKKSRSYNFKLREKFKNNEIPSDGQSNDYFFQAALQCNTDGLNIDEAKRKIEAIHTEWTKSKFYSGRTWSNIEKKIDEVYENNYKIEQGRPKEDSKDKLVNIAKKILTEFTLFSDPQTRQLFVTDNGFPEDVTVTMEKMITNEYETTRSETKEIIHFLIGKAEDMPSVNYDYIMFKDRMFDVIHNIDVEKDPNIICAIGFKDYNYISNPSCPKFIKLIDDHVEESSLSNLFACLSTVATPYRQTRMAMLYGPAGTGKTTLAESIIFSLGQAGYAMKISDFIADRAHESKLRGKTCMYFQDAPKTLKDIEKLKVTTGENLLSIRDLYKSAEGVRNMLTVLITSNHLISIDKDEEGPMFDRLTLVKFHSKIRDTPKEIDQYALEIAREEGENIISFCLNLRREGYKFDNSETVKRQWKDIANPEEKAIKENFYFAQTSDGMNIFEIIAKLKGKYPDQEYDIKELEKALVNCGYTKSRSLFLGISFIEAKNGQEVIS